MAVTVIQNAQATVKIDGKDYSAQVKNLTLTVDTSSDGGGESTLSGDKIPESTTFQDKMTGTVVQDWPAPSGGLIGATRIPANRGKVVPFEITAVQPAGYSATGTLTLTPLDLTIDPNGRAESDVEWSIVTIAETYPTAAPLDDVED